MAGEKFRVCQDDKSSSSHGLGLPKCEQQAFVLCHIVSAVVIVQP
jgi:hypothetical protein